jgi:hypothetical protein
MLAWQHLDAVGNVKASAPIMRGTSRRRCNLAPARDFAEGTGDHVRWMAHGGIHAYASSYPQVPYQVFFVSLIVLDPLVVVLAAVVRREAVWLACALMVADIGANWAGNWRRILDYLAHLAANAPWLITAFGIFVFATALPLARAMTLQTVPASS